MVKKQNAATAKSLQSDSVRHHRRQLCRSWDFPGKNTGVGCHFLLQCMKVKSESEVTQSSPTLCEPMDCSPPGSSVHGIFQARVLEWGAIAYMLQQNPKWGETSWMGKTGDLFKKIRDTKGAFHAKMGTIKDRNSMDLTEAEDVTKRWQEYTEELF